MERFKFIAKKDIEKLPKTTGVYLLAHPKSAKRNLGGFNVMYIGKAINIKSRVKNHFHPHTKRAQDLLGTESASARYGVGVNQPSYRDNLFINKITKIGFFETGSEIEALILEASLIKKYQPKYNVMWRDDKNYFYVAIAKNKQGLPYIFITHQPSKKLQTTHYKLQTNYIGPFVEGTALKKTLRFLRKAFPYYTSTLRRGSGQLHSKNKCTWCHLDLCPGPYKQLLTPRPDGLGTPSALGEYKKNVKKLILILKGKRSAALNLLNKEMKQLAKENKFEEAGKVKDRIFALRQVMSHTHVIENNIAKVAATPDASATLGKIIDLKTPATKIECYDVSNIQGKQATGSMVVFVNGKPDKSQYRKFKIRGENSSLTNFENIKEEKAGKQKNYSKLVRDKPNDIAMLKETLQRRLNHPEWKYPEVILIDGGIAQFNIALKIKNQNAKFKMTDQNVKINEIKILALAKRNKELFIEGRDKPVLLKTLPREIYNLIVHLDDEAHRFAISYHRKLRKKKLMP